MGHWIPRPRDRSAVQRDAPGNVAEPRVQVAALLVSLRESVTPMIFYTAQQVSVMTSMSVDWLWQQCREQTIPHHKLGGRYRWTDQDLAALALQSAVAAVVVDDDELIPSRHGRRWRLDG